MADEHSNEDQITYWNEQAGPRWVDQQVRLDAMLDPFTELALEAAGVAAGSRVLDVGCGCGALSLAAADRVESGSVTGIDISAPMLAHARERARKHATPIRFLEADAQAHGFEPESFDSICSRFGVMFFGDPVAAFARLRAALAPGGRLAFVCWQSPESNPWMSVPMMTAAKHVELDPPPPPGAPGPFAFADAQYVRGLLERAGFAEVEVIAQEGTIGIAGGVSAKEAADFMLGLGPVASAIRELDAAAAERLRADLHDALAPHEGPAGVHMPHAAWVVRAS